jgi:TRAP-type mannitol/chloroaromatic compound transport system permease large subunit
MSEIRHRKGPLAYIADSSFRYAVFGLSAYLVYSVATDRETMQIREGILHFGIVICICVAIGIVISSLTWWFMREKDDDDGRAT